MSGNNQGANAFPTNATGGGVGISTADPAASTNSWLMATPSNYQNWQSPDWIQSGLTQSTQPIGNYPVTNYGRWNYGNGATNGYGMGASPWPAPSTLFGGSGSAGNGMPTPGTPPAGGGSKAGGGTTPPTPTTPPPAGGGTKAGGGATPGPIGGGTTPLPPQSGDVTAAGGGGGLALAHALAAARGPQAGLATTNGFGLSPHLAGLGNMGDARDALQQTFMASGRMGQPFPAGNGPFDRYGNPIAPVNTPLRPGGRPYPSGS